jgi:hypothetical protein
MAKYNTSKYIELAQEKWGTKFDYTKVLYKNSYHKVAVKCLEHDETFEVDPIAFIRPGTTPYDFCTKCVPPAVLPTQCTTAQKDGQSVSDNTNAVFYKIAVHHEETKLVWTQVGTALVTGDQPGHYANAPNGFKIEVLEEVFGTQSEVLALKENFKHNNKHKLFYVPSAVSPIASNDDCYITQDEIQLKANQVKFVRDGLLEKQSGVCPICARSVKLPVLDHFHTKRHNGDGKIRGVLCNTCNRMIGVIENNAIKNGINFSDLPSFLKRCADYASKDHYPLIHPSEVERNPKVSKRNYNQLKKVYDKKAKFPEYPASAKLTKRLAELFDEYSISPYN